MFSVAAEHPYKIELIQDAGNGIPHDVLPRADAEDVTGSLVDLLDPQIPAHGHDGVGGHIDDLVGIGLCLFLHVRQAHGNIRPAKKDRFCFFAASGVTADAAVQLVLRRVFAHTPQDAAQLLLRRFRAENGSLVQRAFQPDLFFHKKIVLAAIQGGILDRRDGTCFFLFFFLKSGTADAGARAGGHFNKAVLQLSIHRVLQRCDAVLHAVHRQITPAGLALHGAQDAAGHRKHPGQLDRTGGVRIADHDAAFPQPVLQLVKGQVIIRAVCAAQSHRLCLFRDAGAEKHDSSARAALTDQACHRPKRRHHRRHIGDRIREIFLHVLID